MDSPIEFEAQQTPTTPVGNSLGASTISWRLASAARSSVSKEDIGSGSGLDERLEREDAAPKSYDGPHYNTNVSTVSARKYVVIFVGLPARGKTFLAHKLCVLLGWLGHSARVFNVQRVWRDYLSGRHKESGGELDGMSRRHSSGRNAFGSQSPGSEEGSYNLGLGPYAVYTESPLAESPSYDTFDFLNNAHSRKMYTGALKKSGDRVKTFFEEGGLVAFMNDDFCSRELRDEAEAILAPLCDEVLFIEVIRDDNTAFDALKVKSASENYKEMPETNALNDFKSRVQLLEATYTHVGEDKRYIKVLNGRKIEIHAVSGYIPSRMVSFMMNLSQNRVAHPIYFSRHGQTTYNVEDRIGGNPILTEKGHIDSLCLTEFIGELRKTELQTTGSAEMQMWTSQLIRTIQTARPSEEAFGIKCLRWSSLNEIHAGVCEELTYADVKTKFPLIHEFRKTMKYSFRYPAGESYQDLVARLEPVIMELENASCPVVVIAHQAILRALLAYFGEASAQSSVDVDVPHRTVWRCTATANGTSKLEEVNLNHWFEENGKEIPTLPEGFDYRDAIPADLSRWPPPPHTPSPVPTTPM